MTMNIAHVHKSSFPQTLLQNVDFRLQRLSVDTAINEHTTISLTLPNGLSLYQRQAKPSGLMQLLGSALLIYAVEDSTKDSAEGQAAAVIGGGQKELIIRGAEISMCDSHDPGQHAFHMRATLSVLCSLLSTRPLQISLVSRLAPLSAQVDLDRLFPALQSQHSNEAPKRRKSTMAQIPRNDDERFASLPFRLVCALQMHLLSVQQIASCRRNLPHRRRCD
jgi:hypothetical protein